MPVKTQPREILIINIADNLLAVGSEVPRVAQETHRRPLTGRGSVAGLPLKVRHGKESGKRSSNDRALFIRESRKAATYYLCVYEHSEVLSTSSATRIILVLKYKEDRHAALWQCLRRRDSE